MGIGIILFDGDRAFCNGRMNWIMERDNSKRFGFAPIASEEGLTLREKHGVPDTIHSIVQGKDNQAFTRSDAAWRLLKDLPGYRLLGSLVRIVLRPLRNWGYDLVAHTRHRFGLKHSCELPGV